MKDLLRRLFGFLLVPLERGTEDYRYQPMHRSVLVAMGLVFLGLSLGVAWVAFGQQAWSYLAAALIFGPIGLLGLIVGTLGNDRAVSKIWGNK